VVGTIRWLAALPTGGDRGKRGAGGTGVSAFALGVYAAEKAKKIATPIRQFLRCMPPYTNMSLVSRMNQQTSNWSCPIVQLLVYQRELQDNLLTRFFIEVRSLQSKNRG